MDISPKVNQLFKQTGKRKKDLLEFLGKNWNGSIKNIINSSMKLDTLVGIADFFEVSVDELLGHTPKNGTTTQPTPEPTADTESTAYSDSDTPCTADAITAAKDEIIAAKDATINALRAALAERANVLQEKERTVASILKTVEIQSVLIDHLQSQQAESRGRTPDTTPAEPTPDAR